MKFNDKELEQFYKHIHDNMNDAQIEHMLSYKHVEGNSNSIMESLTEAVYDMAEDIYIMRNGKEKNIEYKIKALLAHIEYMRTDNTLTEDILFDMERAGFNQALSIITNELNRIIK